MRLYLDSSAIIYAVEGVLGFRDAVVESIARVDVASGGRVFTSRLSRLECRVRPLREGYGSTQE